MANVLLAGLRGAKQLGKNLGSAYRSLSSGSSPKWVEPGYDFGRKRFGPDYGVTTSVGQYGLPKSVDWRDVPWVQIPVKSRLNSGSSYIQASLMSIESLVSITSTIPIELSAQHILDANTITNFGCKSGTAPNVFDFIMRNGGVVAEYAYPYTGNRGICQNIQAEGVTIESWINVRPVEEALMYAVAHQPVVVRVAVGKEFANYSTGTIKVPEDHGKTNQSMLLIGYNEADWLLLNSKGKRWGMEGACWIPRKSPNIDGAIGILSSACLPLNPSFVSVTTRTESCPLHWIGKKSP
ncbi:zingipain-2 [Triticum aestivum]|nr:zingipain-2-like [Triticum aestivum]